MNIEWKQIVIDNITTFYAVSNNGLIKNMNRNKELKTHIQNGYLHVTLSINKKPKRFNVHRLVAIMFIPNNNLERNIVNHKDGNKINNKVENLEWVTAQENTQHAWDTGLAVSVVKRKIKQFDLSGNYIKTYNSIVDAAHETNSSDTKIVSCCKKERISHNNFFWQYEEDENTTFLNNYTPPTVKKTVGQYDFNGNLICTYESATKAAKMINGTQSAITRCCNGKNNHHKGFIWKFIG